MKSGALRHRDRGLSLQLWFSFYSIGLESFTNSHSCLLAHAHLEAGLTYSWKQVSLATTADRTAVDIPGRFR